MEESLKSVNLFNGGVGDKKAGKYSGGMKRRLSVAISLIGDPKVSFISVQSTLPHETFCGYENLLSFYLRSNSWKFCKVVYMDEPSTGLDPASRSNLWSVVKRAKQNRAIILTSTLSLSLSLHMSVIDKMSFFPSGCRWSHPTGLVLHMLDNTITAQWHLEPL